MPPAGLQPTTAASELPQTQSLTAQKSRSVKSLITYQILNDLIIPCTAVNLLLDTVPVYAAVVSTCHQSNVVYVVRNGSNTAPVRKYEGFSEVFIRHANQYSSTTCSFHVWIRPYLHTWLMFSVLVCQYTYTKAKQFYFCSYSLHTQQLLLVVDYMNARWPCLPAPFMMLWSSLEVYHILCLGRNSSLDY
jgi:hypothetical protein